LKRFHCSLFIVHFSFVIAETAVFHNAKRQMPNER